jgi:hypothetical protein
MKQREIPVIGAKARDPKIAWAVSGVRDAKGDEEEDFYRVFKKSEYEVFDEAIEISGLDEGHWTIIIVEMHEDGHVKQGITKVDTDGRGITVVPKSEGPPDLPPE